MRQEAGTGREPAPARTCDPAELRAEGGSITVSARTEVAPASQGPFAPVAVALEQSSALRDAFARAIPVPSLTAWWRLRWVVFAMATIPLAMLLELDRELVGRDLVSQGRFLVDGAVAAYVAYELTRRTPRLPAIAGLAMLAVAMRWGLVVTRLCAKDVHPAVWAAAGASAAAGLVILARAPSRGRVALELMGKLGISRTDALAARATAGGAMPESRLVGGAVAAAAGLPLLLYALRRGGVEIVPQAAAFVAYGVVVPPLVHRLAGSARGAAGAASATGTGPDARARVVRVLLAILAGLTATAALVHGTHQFFEAGGELARCTSRLDEASRRMLAAEAAELARRIANVRASTALALMTTAVMPLAEERIYRGLLMDTLVKRYGFTYGLFAASVAFGLAHVGVYELALYQTVLLGVGFGLAYAEGGIVAAFVVHAMWNLLNVA